MTVEMLKEMKIKCVFVPDWRCPIETSEIPLEVCKLCLEARKIQSKQVKIARQVKSVEMLPSNVELDVEVEVPQAMF